MAIEVGAVTGRAVRVVRLADGATDQEPGCGAMAGLAAEGLMGFFAGAAYIWGSRSVMAAKADCHHWHAVAMAMTVEITGNMAGLTGTTASRHGRGIGGRRHPGSGCGIVTGRTGVMHLVVGRINRNAGGSTDNSDRGVAGSAITGSSHLGHMVGNGMVHKVGAMTGITVTATSRHDRGLSSCCHQCAVSLMAGGAGIMHLVIGRINRNAGRRANDCCREMTGVAVSRIRNPGQVV